MPEQSKNQSVYDEHAFNNLVHENHRQIYLLFRRMVGDQAEADDLTQETFIKVYQSLPKFRHESSIRTWIYRIAINKGLNYLRRMKIRQTLGLEYVDKEMEHSESKSHEASRSLLRPAVAKLPPRQQMVVILRSFQELSFREIAVILNMTENSAKVNYSHALKNLRQILLKMGVTYDNL